MSRIRSLKPEALSSETLSHLHRSVRWTFAGLWTYCDDQGRGVDNVRLIKAALYPLDDDVTATDLDSELDQMVKLGLVCRYSVDGRRYLHVVNFAEHQHPSKPQPSRLPECSGKGHGTLPPESEGEEEPFYPQTEASDGALPVGGEGRGREGSRKGMERSGSRARGARTDPAAAAAPPDDHRPLIDALAQVGIRPAWDAPPDDLSLISSAIARVGVRTLVKHAQSRWQADNPAFSVRAFVAGWAAIPSPPAPRQRQREPCDHGADDGRLCALCRTAVIA